MATLGRNIVFPIKNADGTPFHNLVLRKATVDSVVMSLGDKITGDVYYQDNTLQCTMQEYVEYNNVKYAIVNPPTIVREGLVKDNSDLKGMTKYSFEFYHPMYILGNLPFSDVAVSFDEERYLSQNKTFSWIGKPQDYINKINKNLEGTEWIVVKSERFPQEKDDELSDVLSFDNNTIADALKTGYETWGLPYVVSQINNGEPYYSQEKRFKVEFGLPSNEILVDNEPYIFQFGQGVGLKNNSRTPRNNKIITRIAGYGSENNIPYGYPQIRWHGNQSATETPAGYPIYDGIVGGVVRKLIKHPFTRTHLMPSIYTQTVFNKVSPYLANGNNNPDYNPNEEIIDYYDAISSEEYPYINEINLLAPSYEIHAFDEIKPELDSERQLGIVSAIPLNQDLTPASKWDDTYDAEKDEYVQSYFKITLPQLSFDLYACASIMEEMQVNMRSGACIGCTFPIQVDWEDYKRNFYDANGNFLPDGSQRDLTKYPKSNLWQIDIIVQKETQTFGTLMPNIYQQPTANDLFVILGISMPVEYITDAEERLDDAMKSYMLENNVYYYDYPLKFDEYFLATHTNILAQIRPNSIIRFGFKGYPDPLELFVKQITIKYGDDVLPQYDITLTDNIEIVLNQIGQVADDVEKLGSLVAILRQTYNRNIWSELDKKLSKVKDDSTPHKLGMGEMQVDGDGAIGNDLSVGGDLQVDGDATIHGETVTEGTLHVKTKAIFGGNADEHTVRGDDLVAYSIYGAGYGWKIDRAGNMEVESLKVDSYLETNELRINRLQAQEGDTIYTDNDQIEEVEEIVDETEGTVLYRLTFKEKWEGYFTAQRYGNILKGIINTLAAAYIGALDNSSGSPVTFTTVVSPTGNPKEQGYYEYADGKYVPTGDLSVETGKTYYTVSAKGGYEEEEYSATLNPREVGLYERSGSTYFRSTDTEMDVTKTYYRKIQGEDSVGNKYFTSWMWVVGDRNTAPAMCGLNQVLVALWEDYDSLPQNKNFAPCVNMALGRWGCIDYSTPIDPEHDTPAEIAEKERLIADIKARQTFFYLSASEGRFMKLKDVAQPLLEEGNYGMVFGNTPDFIKTRADWEQLIEKHPHLKERDYLFAQGLIYSDLVQLNIKGVPVVAIVDCGDWIDGSTAGTAIATGDDSALADEDDNITEYDPGDTIITPKVTKGIYFYRSWNVATCRFETHTVRHKNGKWMCLVDQPVITNGVKVYHEPKWNSVYWKLVEGNSDFSVDLESNRGTTFRIGYVNTTIIPTVFYGMVSITEDLSAEYFSWTRTVDTSEERSQAAIDADTAWNTLHQHVKNLVLGNGDMPMDWGYDRRAIFECTVTIINGSETRTVTQQVIV